MAERGTCDLPEGTRGSGGPNQSPKRGTSSQRSRIAEGETEGVGLNYQRYCLGLGDSGMVVCVGACDGATVGCDLYQTNTRARKMSTRTVESAIPFLPWPLRS